MGNLLVLLNWSLLPQGQINDLCVPLNGSLVPQGDVLLPEVPSEELPELPEESEEEPGRAS